jgi:EAL domain-containing protein (putative c-di-GMP-specific phosphodiesterase class I)/ActR/RegA family two-component response regulator
MKPEKPPARRPNRPVELKAPQANSKVLVVDDERDLVDMYARILKEFGYLVTTAEDGKQALERLAEDEFDAIVSDINMPGMDGVRLLRAVREKNLDVPVLLVTGKPSLDSAVQAVEYGALKYITKPIDMEGLLTAVGGAVRLHRMARLKREALALMGTVGKNLGDRAGLEASFERAIQSITMVYQPIVRWSKKKVFAFEALVRSTEPALARPDDLIDAAERLGRLQQMGRAIRAHVAATMDEHPDSPQIFVNLHTLDLEDPELYDLRAPLSRMAQRVVLEITERAALDRVRDVQNKVLTLREMGYRIALDDLGAGYAGLTAFAQLQPDVVKLDMSLVRDVNREPTKLRLVKSMVQLCGELGMLAVAEGIENKAERDALAEAGCDLLQGYLFAKPGPPFPTADFARD